MRSSKRSRNARPAPMIPHELKYDIARAVRAFTMTQAGGTCMMRALTGNRLLNELGLPAHLVPGSVIYRAGPDPVADVVSYHGVGNVGYFTEGGLYGHVWNELRGEIVDLSTGDWRREGDLIVELFPDGLPPVQWQVEPPEFLWQPAGPLKSAWQPIGAPTLVGQFWYGPWASPKPPNYQEVSWAVNVAMGAVREEAQRLCLAERVCEWKSMLHGRTIDKDCTATNIESAAPALV